jgi:hypothetical protein
MDIFTQQSTEPKESVSLVTMADRQDFETRIDIPLANRKQLLYTIALDGDGNILGATQVFDAESGAAIGGPPGLGLLNTKTG